MQSSDEELDESMMDEETFDIEDEEMNSYAPSEESESSASDVDSEEDNEYVLLLDPNHKSQKKVSKTFACPEMYRKYVVWYSTVHLMGLPNGFSVMLSKMIIFISIIYTLTSHKYCTIENKMAA